MPDITNGYTDMTPGESDVVVGELPKASYNDSITIFCDQGFYMDGPNVSFCGELGEWTELPMCRGVY